MLYERARDHISNLSDQDLAEYVKEGTEMYDPEAVAFARQEMERRGVSAEQLRELESQAEARIEQRNAEAEEMAKRPLGTTGRILAFAGGFIGFPLLIFLIASGRMRDRGEYRKARELRHMGFMGFAVFMLLGMVAGIFFAK